MGDYKRMRSILEQAVIHHLNGEDDKASALFHQFIVARARQIHESMRNGDDVLAEGWDETIASEEYFGSGEDLSELEDDGAEDVGGDVPADDADLDGGEDFGGEDDFGGDEGEEDFGGEGDDFGDEGEEDDLGAELDAHEEDDAALADKVEDLEAELARLTAKFEEMEGTSDEAADDADLAGDLQDDMGEPAAGEEEAPFQGMGESTASELEKVNVSLKTDGREIGTGSTFTQQRRSGLPQRKVTDRVGGEPVELRAKEHKGFERETAPGVAAMKKRRNTLDKGRDTLSPVKATDKAEGKEVGASGKTVAKNTKSPVAPRKGSAQ